MSLPRATGARLSLTRDRQRCERPGQLHWLYSQAGVGRKSTKAVSNQLFSEIPNPRRKAGVRDRYPLRAVSWSLCPSHRWKSGPFRAAKRVFFDPGFSPGAGHTNCETALSLVNRGYRDPSPRQRTPGIRNFREKLNADCYFTHPRVFPPQTSLA
jgi:hypothetical protein